MLSDPLLIKLIQALMYFLGYFDFFPNSPCSWSSVCSSIHIAALATRCFFNPLFFNSFPRVFSHTEVLILPYTCSAFSSFQVQVVPFSQNAPTNHPSPSPCKSVLIVMDIIQTFSQAFYPLFPPFYLSLKALPL